jgi:hypothetical protein
MPSAADLLLRCLRLLLRPAIRFSLKHGLKHQDLIEAAKHVFVEESQRELPDRRKPNVSRINAMTGVHRKDVQRIVESEGEPKGTVNLLMRVIGQWRNHKDFCRGDGRARVLSCGFADSEFNQLVGTISKDLNPGTVLFELERLGSVEATSRGVRLKSPSLVIRGDAKEGYELAARDVIDLFEAVSENVEELPENLHLKTEFDNIPTAAIPKIRAWVSREGTLFQEKVQRYLSSFDRDANPKVKDKNGRARVAVGSFSRVEVSKEGAKS